MRLSKLLTATGLAASASEADRKIKEGAVRIEGEVVRHSHIPLNGSGRVALRVGKRAKIAVIE